MKLALVILLAILGLLFLALDAFITGGVVTASGASWLESAGLASWCASWLVSVLPIP